MLTVYFLPDPGSLSPRPTAELSEDVVDVAFHRAPGDDQLLGDLAIRVVRGYEGKDFAFALRQHIE
jgi:hypothetical protein